MFNQDSTDSGIVIIDRMVVINIAREIAFGLTPY